MKQDSQPLELIDTSPRVEVKVRRNEVAAVDAPPPDGPMAGALAFLKSGGSPEQLEKMMELQQRWLAEQARMAYVADMAEFKKMELQIFKNKRVSFPGRDGKTATDYWHAELSDVTDTVVPALALHGFSSRWDVKRDGERVHVTCIVTHRQGHSESVTLEGPLDGSGNKNAIQQQGSTVTYLSRYTLLTVLGLATKSVQPDNDGRDGARGKNDYDPKATLKAWADQAQKATTTASLLQLRKDARRDFEAGKDIEGWDSLKAILAQRAEQIERVAK